MASIEYIIGGQVVSADDIARFRVKPKARSGGSADDSYHKGFRVVGHPPGAMESAHEDRKADRYAWTAMSEQQRASALKEGRREPRPWDEAAWRMNTKKRPIRSKPYSIPQAAQDCKALAERAGWIDVEIIEMKRGEIARQQEIDA